MRPKVLFALFADLTDLPGIGDKSAARIAKVAGSRVVDLCWLLPTGLMDRRYRPRVSEVRQDVICTMEVQVLHHAPPGNPRLPHRVICADDTGQITLVFFRGDGEYLHRILPEGETRFISGRTERFRGALQMPHPDHVMTAAEFAAMPPVEPVYPLTQGMSANVMRKAVSAALTRLPDLPEWRRDPSGPSWREALRTAHGPEDESALSPQAPARRQLAYDELLANQLALMLVRARMRGRKGRVLAGTGRLDAAARAALPYALTPAQETALEQINADMASGARMVRLLQADVGSGKTVVAVLAMLRAAESGVQSALMAPTDVLARQHRDTLAPLCAAAGVRMALLTGRKKGSARAQVLDELRNGDISIIVGTHALFQDAVQFHDLGLAVIDEQHRFGVYQRMHLSNKGKESGGRESGGKESGGEEPEGKEPEGKDTGGRDAPSAAHVLAMTATPIPRTLMMTAYGDVDVSRLTGKPPGRGKVETRAVPWNRTAEVVQHLKTALERGGRAYWVCPLIQESAAQDVAAAEDRHRELAHTFGSGVALIHGRMPNADKDRTWKAFRDGAFDVLVATTVIEVGMDVPEANIMVIESAERFSLSQLHQLRGRVGRGTEAGACVLLYRPPLGEMAAQRLRIMRETSDGFRIAEEDLRLRGAGEVLGARQSGLPVFTLADLRVHGDLLAAAHADARSIVDTDPTLTTPRGKALRILLHLFQPSERA